MDDAGWTCTVCTYLNQNMTFLSCEMCGSTKICPPKNVHPFFNATSGSGSAKVIHEERGNGLRKGCKSGQIQLVDLSLSYDSDEERECIDSGVSCSHSLPAEEDALDADGFILLPRSPTSAIACISTNISSRAFKRTQQNIGAQSVLSRAKLLLRQHYNSDAELRPFQKRAILSVVAQKRDCLVVSATGSGKSASFT